MLVGHTRHEILAVEPMVKHEMSDNITVGGRITGEIDQGIQPIETGPERRFPTMTTVFLAVDQVAHVSHTPQATGDIPAPPAVGDRRRAGHSRIPLERLAGRFDQKRANDAAGDRERRATDMARQATRLPMKSRPFPCSRIRLLQHVEHRALERIESHEFQFGCPGNPGHRHLVIEVNRPGRLWRDQALIDRGLGIHQ